MNLHADQTSTLKSHSQKQRSNSPIALSSALALAMAALSALVSESLYLGLPVVVVGVGVGVAVEVRRRQREIAVSGVVWADSPRLGIANTSYKCSPAALITALLTLLAPESHSLQVEDLEQLDTGLLHTVLRLLHQPCRLLQRPGEQGNAPLAQHWVVWLIAVCGGRFAAAVRSRRDRLLLMLIACVFGRVMSDECLVG